MGLTTFADRMAAMNVLTEEKLSHCTRVSVEGYDTSLPVHAITSALRVHFMSCGQVWSVVIPKNPINSCVVERCGFIYFEEEEDAQEKASRHADDVKSELFRHFSSCGEIIYLTVDQDRRQPKGVLRKWAFICINGEDALDKARALSGTDLGGWTVTVWTLPEECGKMPDNLINLPIK
ncbi:unnamed protein product [Arabis nemorensis]|uniref:RRM domain-containing protein n=1 Tax=Arabis nemorensis TaxID=586526 RepID=A0A565AUR3_9BRAS|nr:unnamed protein product [Arabis nemorensis]